MALFSFSGGGAKANQFGGNAFGSAVDPRVTKQLRVRSFIKAKKNKNDDEISFLNSKTAWVKLSSSSNINGSPDLAKKNILFGGTMFQEETAFRLRQGFDLSNPDKSAYTRNPGDKGIVPLPGITNFKYSVKGAGVGATVMIDIEFQVYDLTQYELFEELYLKLGSYQLVEFGNSTFVDNSGNIRNDGTTVDIFFENDKTQIEIEDQIRTITENSDYNYKGVFAKVANYNVGLGNDGVYTMKLSLIGKGTILEALKATGKPLPLLASPGGNEQYQNDIKALDNKTELTQAEIQAVKDQYDNKLIESSKTATDLSPVTDILSIFQQKGQTPIDALALVQEKGYACEWDKKRDIPIFLQKAASKQTEQPEYTYIRFETWVKIMNDTLLPTGNKGEKLIKMVYGYNIFSAYATYANHFALDPGICILPKLPQNENLYTAWRKKDVFATGTGNNIYDLWLNVNMLKDTLQEMYASAAEYTVDLADYIDTVLGKINQNLGGFNDIKISYLEKNSSFVFIDDKLHTARNINRSEIQVQGLESNVEEIKLETKVTGKLASQNAILSRDTSGKTSADGSILSSLGSVVDRFKVKVQDTTGDAIGEDVEQDSPPPAPPEEVTEFEELINSFVGDLQRDPKDFETGTTNFGNYVRKEFVRLFGKYPFGKLPFELSLTMDGIAGFKMNEKFKISPGLLPSYLTERSTYTIIGISHDIKDNRWTTSITSMPGISQGPSGERFAEIKDETLNKSLNPVVAEKINPDTKNASQNDI